MISAFGVEHEFSKTLVPGKGYVKATELTPGMKNIVRTRLKPPSDKDSLIGRMSDNIPGKKVKGQSAKGRQIHEEFETRSLNRKITTDVLSDTDAEHKLGTVLGHSKPNGRGGGILRMNMNDSPERRAVTYKHELAHLKPKRNPVRFGERVGSSERRLGREEGRADYTAHGRRTPGNYPGSDDFQRGYNEVQGKMSRGRKKPRKFAVDSSGTAVQKNKAEKLIRSVKLRPLQPPPRKQGKGTAVIREDPKWRR